MEALIWIDYVILGVVLVSAAVSLFRGFVREAVSAAGWVAAAWLALTFFEPSADYLAPYLSAPSARLAVAFIAIFMGTLLVTGVVGYLAGLVVDKTGLSGTDRVLGMVFGAVRGAVIVALMVMIAGLTAIPRDPWWRESSLLPHFERFAVEIRGALPPDIATKLQYAPLKAAAGS